MAEDESSSELRSTPPAAKLSKTPSWVMLGFILGAVFVAALPPWRRPAPLEAKTASTPEPARKPAVIREPGPLTTIEAVFAVWQRYAVWSDDTTEVALWNIREKAFTDFYEVRRLGDTLYFRTIPKLTRRILTHGKLLPNSPLQFTETEEQYQEWREHGRSERPATQDLRPTVPTTPIDPTINVSPNSKEAFPPKFEVPATLPGVLK